MPLEVWLESSVGMELLLLATVVQVVVNVVQMLVEVDMKFGPSSRRVRLGTVRFRVGGLGRGQRSVLLGIFYRPVGVHRLAETRVAGAAVVYPSVAGSSALSS